MDPPQLEFKTIDLDRHADVCVRFRRDSFVVSFGAPDRFDEGLGVKKYVAWLANEIASLPEGFVHAWDGDRIVGQIEARVLPGPPARGYVNLYYLVPEHRGRHVGDQLDAHVERLFRLHGVSEARLTVSNANAAARRFYARRGWVDIGPRPGQEGCRFLERTYDTV